MYGNATNLELGYTSRRGPRILSAVSTGLTVVGIVTLILALAGVYAIMALIVTKRTREIGIRIAMGATASRGFRMGAVDVGCGAGALMVAGIVATAAPLRRAVRVQPSEAMRVD